MTLRREEFISCAHSEGALFALDNGTEIMGT